MEDLVQMYRVEFYETEDGDSQIWDFLEDLRLKAAVSKDARIQHKQASLYIELLKQNGTRLNENITKHIEDGIWELRPGNNRVFYFFFRDNIYVLVINSERNPRRLQSRKVKRQNEKGMTIYSERRKINENLG